MPVPDYPFPADDPLAPAPRLAELRRTEPVSRVEFAGAPAWLLTRHADIRAAIAEPELAPYLPGMVEGTEEDLAAAEQSGFLMLMSGDPHARLRRTVSGALSARRVAALRPAAEVRARGLVGALSGAGDGEFLADVAAPLAIGTLGDLIGVDVTARDEFTRWSDDSATMFGQSDPELIRDSGAALFGFIGDLVRAERDGDGLVGDLFRCADPGGAAGRLTEEEVSGLVGQLLMAGYVPTAMVLTLAAYRLLGDPALAAAVRAEPSLLPGTVDEMLRLDPGGAGNVDRAFRARADVQIGGVRIGRGEVVLVPLGAANRDPEVFGDPDRIDPTRRPNPHLSFFPGPHHCLGAALARMQLEVVLAALLDAGPIEVPGVPRWGTGPIGDVQLRALPVRARTPGPDPTPAPGTRSGPTPSAP